MRSSKARYQPQGQPTKAKLKEAEKCLLNPKFGSQKSALL